MEGKAIQGYEEIVFLRWGLERRVGKSAIMVSGDARCSGAFGNDHRDFNEIFHLALSVPTFNV